MNPARFRDTQRFGPFTPRPDRPLPAGLGTAAFVGQVVTATTAVSVGSFLLVTPVTVLGAEAEGGAGSITANGTATVPVYLVGPKAARQGDLLVCRFVGHRWVAERMGSHPTGGYTLAGCPCTSIPATLALHVASQPTNGTISLVFPASLSYMTKPDDLATYLSDPTGYYSPAKSTSADGLYTVRYWFGCSQGAYFVDALLTPDSALGYPGRITIMTWLVGLPGNTCTPFRLTNGYTASQTYQAQGISITG